MKKGNEAIWVLVGSIIALIVLVVVIGIFVNRVGEGNKKLRNIGDQEIGALDNNQYCNSIILQRSCFEKCPTGYKEVQAPEGGFKDCKEPKKCCQKIE